MARQRQVVETQLNLAKASLEAYEKSLKEKNPDRRPLHDPRWRHLRSDVKRFQEQLKAVEKRESFRK